MNKPIYIIFSGGCYSGKTTSINIVKDILKAKGKNVIMFDELIRNHNIGSIDEIRKSPNKYMELQDNIIRGKIEMEKSIKNNPSYGSNTIVLVDRAVTDSLFYLTFYVYKNGLDEYHQEMFFNLFDYLNNYLENDIRFIYDYILEFKPIENKVEEDSFRPQNLNRMQNVEYEMIKKYNHKYFENVYFRYKYINIDLNKVNINDMKQYWEEKLNDMNL